MGVTGSQESEFAIGSKHLGSAEAAGWVPRAVAGARNRAKGKTQTGKQDKKPKRKQKTEEGRKGDNRRIQEERAMNVV